MPSSREHSAATRSRSGITRPPAAGRSLAEQADRVLVAEPG